MKQGTIAGTTKAVGIQRSVCWILALVLLITCNMPSLAFAATGGGSLQAAELSTQSSELVTQADEDTFADENTRVGDGSESSPYQLSTLADLNKLAELINDSSTNATYAEKAYSLMADITINESWSPIGTATSNAVLASAKTIFKGVFNGNYHTVTFGSDSSPILASKKCFALFGAAIGATISDLKIAGSIQSSTGLVSGVVAVAGNTTIKNTGNSANIISTDSASSGVNIGGLVASQSSAVSGNTIVSCYNKGAITGSYNGVGGLIGYTGSSSNVSTLSSCYNLGTIASNKSDATGVGGITGSQNPKVLNSYNFGDVVVTNAAETYVNSGSISGYNTAPVTSTFVPANETEASYYYVDSVKNGADPTLRGKAGDSTKQATYYISKSLAEMKTLESVLNVAETDYSDRWVSGNGINESGTPALAWEAPATTETYDIACTVTNNGSIALSENNATAGSQVTITATPNIGYVLDAIAVVDADNNAVAVSNGTFTMPASDVTVTVTFKEDESLANESNVIYVEAIASTGSFENGATYVFTAPHDAANSIMGTDGASVSAFSGAIDTIKDSITFDSPVAALGAEWTAVLDGENISFTSKNGKGLNLTIQYGARIASGDLQATQLVWKNGGLRAASPETPGTNRYGWLACVEGAFKMTTLDDATAPATKVKVWKVVPPTYYAVTFDTDGAGTVDAQSVLKGETATEPAAPTKDGYIFKGWQLGDAVYDFSIPVTSDLELKALWVDVDTAAAQEVEALASNDSTTDAELVAAYEALSDGAKAKVDSATAAKVIAAQKSVADAAVAEAEQAQADAENAAAKAAEAQKKAEAEASSSASDAATAKAEAETQKKAAETAANEAAAAKAKAAEATTQAEKLEGELSTAQKAADAQKTAAASAQKEADKAKTAQAAAEKAAAEAEAAQASAEAEAAAAQAASAKADISGATVTVAKATFTGKALAPKVTVKLAGKALAADADYTVKYVNNKKAGTGVAIVTGKGSYEGSAAKTFTIAKAKNTMTATAKAKTNAVKYSKLAKKAQTITKAKAFKISKAKGKVTFNKKSGNKKIAVNKKTGKVTVKKGLKKGTYKVKVRVKAAGTANYRALAKTVTLKIKVK